MSAIFFSTLVVFALIVAIQMGSWRLAAYLALIVVIGLVKGLGSNDHDRQN